VRSYPQRLQGIVYMSPTHFPARANARMYNMLDTRIPISIPPSASICLDTYTAIFIPCMLQAGAHLYMAYLFSSSARQESSRYASYDPMKDMQKLHKASKQTIFFPDPPKGPIWGGKPHAPHHRNAPNITSYGSPVDSWVIHCSAGW